MVQPIADKVLSVRQIAIVAGFAMPPSREASHHAIAIQALQRMTGETAAGETPDRTDRFVQAHFCPVVPEAEIAAKPSVRVGRIIDKPNIDFRGRMDAGSTGAENFSGDAFARQGMLGDAQGWWGRSRVSLGGARARSGGGARPF